MVLLGYCGGNQTTGGLSDTRVNSIDLSWIYDESKKGLVDGLE